MSKGERTREQVVEQAAALFNQRGYHGASISLLMQATGLQKGGIYRHFASKEALAVAAFRFATDRLGERFAEALAEQTTALGKLRAIASVFARIPVDPPVPGGCPMLNAAVDSDDGNPELRDEAQRTMNELRKLLRSIVRSGQKTGELGPGADPEAVANVLVAQLEGSVLLCQLLGSQAPMKHTLEHLESWFEQLARR